MKTRQHNLKSHEVVLIFRRENYIKYMKLGCVKEEEEDADTNNMY